MSKKLNSLEELAKIKFENLTPDPDSLPDSEPKFIAQDLEAHYSNKGRAGKTVTPALGETLVADYQTTGLSLEAHPMSLLRDKSAFRTCRRSSELDRLPRHPDLRIWVAGIVATRQRPGSASGVVFITLEDEDGQINCLVWPSLVETFRHQILASRLLKVRGKVQESDGVIHIIADTLEDASEWLGDLKPSSRDFH